MKSKKIISFLMALSIVGTSSLMFGGNAKADTIKSDVQTANITNLSQKSGSTTVFAVEKSTMKNNVNLKAKASHFSDLRLDLTEPGYIGVCVDGYRQSTFSTKDTYVGYGRITSGDPVYALQYLLNWWSDDHKKGYWLTQDGEFGSSTQKALIAFQKWDGISVDGVCGPSTWNALVREMNNR